ncbi:diguanylate cyclase [Haliangium sp.]|uniref:diguanylate cyclase n=1 Tax=Haliangium sp. TaxID=2663208 RepID=UPI003D1445F6
MARWDDITGEISGVTLRGDTGKVRTFERNRPYLIVLSGANMGQMFGLEDGDKIIGRGNDVQIQLLDDGISREHARILARYDQDEPRYWLEDMHSRNGTFCNGYRVGEHLLRDGDKIQLGRNVMLRFGYHDAYDETFQRTMQDSVLRDGLTQVYNKRYFSERLNSEFRFALRHERSLTLMIMDIDHFKQVNDRYGHVAGDHILRIFAQSIQRSVRNEDVFARYGGEEFTLISRAISVEDSQLLGERLRSAIARQVIDFHGSRICITVSIGIATMPDCGATTPVELTDAADRALYWAKTHGRNQVVLFRPGLDERPTHFSEAETLAPPPFADAITSRHDDD